MKFHFICNSIYKIYYANILKLEVLTKREKKNTIKNAQESVQWVSCVILCDEM